MRKINLLYPVFFVILYLLYTIHSGFGNVSAFFFGFAENKEVQLNYKDPVRISKILVSPGQEVVEGQLLIEVSRSVIDFKIDNASHDLEKLQLSHSLQKQNLQNKLQQSQAKKQSTIGQYESQIDNLEAKIRLNQYLLEDLQSIDAPKSKEQPSPNEIKLASLKKNFQLSMQSLDLEITQLEKEIRQVPSPSKIEMKRLKNEIKYYEEAQDHLAIRAPSDGLIGNIRCKEGEHISAFTTLADFYERHPTIVKGFVHESLIPEVNVGDKLQVVSSLHIESEVEGTIIGLGTRIVEIPERLRKIPDLKTYGREILIRIPSVNPFLQKEKVMLNALNENQDTALLSFFWNWKKPNQAAINNH